MNDKLTVLIADDHPIFRRGLREVIELDETLTVVGEAEDGEVALRLLEDLRPQVAVLDIDMPRMNGFQLVSELINRKLPVSIIFLSMHKDEGMLNEAMSLGVLGYVTKDNACNDIVAGIHAVVARQHYISPELSRYLVSRNDRLASFAQQRPGIAALTAAERRVLKLIAENKSSKEIAAALFISHRTVENHRSNICQKLGLHGSHSLLKFAFEHRLELS
jgi:DNA-binding NarL/FixJ family response regulator